MFDSIVGFGAFSSAIGSAIGSAIRVRLMLRNTVNCATLGGQADYRNRDDLAPGKAFREYRLGAIVVGITEGGHQHYIIGDQVIQVTGIGEVTAGSKHLIEAITNRINPACG